MEKATKFKKSRIIALDAGAVLGRVERLILDLDTRQVAGILLEGGRSAIDGMDIRSLGEDAVTVDSAAGIIDLEQAHELAAFLKSEDEVYRKEVFTVAGKKVGFITDVLIDPGQKSVVGFEMFSEFLFKEDVHGVVLLNDQVIFGRDLVLVPADLQGLLRREAPAGEDARTANFHHETTMSDASAPATQAATVDERTPGQSPEIDFDGVPVPRPEVLREAPSQTEPQDQADMAKIFASFPIVGEKQDSPAVPFPQRQEPVPAADAPPAVPAADAPPAVPAADAPPAVPAADAPPAVPAADAPPAVPAADAPPAVPAADLTPSQSPPPEKKEEKPVSPRDKLIKFVMGKTSSRDIFDADGNLILGKGDIIDEAVIEKAREAELMPQVFLAASQGLHSRLKRR